MSQRPPEVIGLTGLPSSGKGEVVAALSACAEKRGLRTAHLSFSDQIREEARARGVREARFERGLLSRIGTELREAEGAGVLAARIIAKIAAWPAPRPDLFIVEALRHPGEFLALKDAYGPCFTLIAVECRPEIIASRLIARARPDEDSDAMRSEAHAIRLLEEELKGTGSDQSPNVGDTIELADLRLKNNGALEELARAVERIFSRWVRD